MKMDAAEAARVIRPHFDELTSQLSPDDRHRAKFVAEVCVALGVEPNLDNGAKVARALEKIGAEPHLAQEYPKWVNHPTNKDDDGNPALVLVYNEGEEKELVEKPKDRTPEQIAADEEKAKLEAEMAKDATEKVKRDEFKNAGGGKLEQTDEQPRRPPPAPVRR